MLRTVTRWPHRLVRRALSHCAPPEIAVAIEYMSGVASAFPARNMVIARDMPAATILVLAPHPDDEAIGMGGTLAMHLSRGSRATVLYMTDGAGPRRADSELTDVRRAEAKAYGQACGVEQIFWNEHDTCLTNSAGTIDRLAEIIHAVNPTSIYLPSYFDRHYDHFSANAILAGAIGKLPYGDDITVLGYEVWENIPFQNYVVDISAHMETKKTLMRHYRTPLQYTDFVQLFECRAAAHYMLYVDSRRQERTGYAEAFTRFDGLTYQRLFRTYVRALQKHRSPMLAHLESVPA